MGPGYIITSIEPSAWDIIHRKVFCLGEGEIARAIQQPNCNQEYSKCLHYDASYILKNIFIKIRTRRILLVCAVGPPFFERCVLFATSSSLSHCSSFVALKPGTVASVIP